MTDYYVSTTGSDANPGTQGSPLLTINEALTRSVNTDVIHVAEGAYPEKLSITKEVQFLGGYQEGSWVRDYTQYVTTIDARALTTGSDAISFSGNLDNTTLFEGFVVWAGDFEISGSNDTAGPAIEIAQNSSPVIRHCEFHGPRGTAPNNKLFTVRPRSSGSQPLFQFCKIYGPKGATAVTGGDKIETITPAKAKATYEDCEIFDGADGGGQHRTHLESENSGTTMIRCVYHAVDNANHETNLPQFKLLTSLTNANFRLNYQKVRSCVLRGAINAGNSTSAIIWWQTTDLDGPFMDYSQCELVDCDLILGTGNDTRFVEDNDIQRHADLINNAGGTWANNRYWNSEAEYQDWVSGGSGGTRFSGFTRIRGKPLLLPRQFV